MRPILALLLVALLLAPALAEEPVLRDPNKYDVGSRLFSLKVETITKEVEPGQELVFRSTILNTDIANQKSVALNFTIRDALGNVVGRIVKSVDTPTVSTTTIERFTIPAAAETGDYVVEGRMDLGKVVWVDTFAVKKTPVVFIFFTEALNNIWTYIILITIVVSYLGWNLYSRFKAVKKAHQKFVSAILEKLPQQGQRSFWIGRVAETTQRAFLDMDKLQMHAIIAGGTGSGKSSVAMVLAEEALLKKIPVVVFDPTGQWTGFIRNCSDPKILALYSRFGLRPENARPFAAQIVQLDENTSTKLSSYIRPGEITVFNFSGVESKVTDVFVKKTIESIFEEGWPESAQLKLLVVYDGVHKLLPKFGGKEGYTAIDRACREFRKWGIGMLMVSQAIMDFRGAIRTNIGTEIQLRTKYDGDIMRVRKKYGPLYAETITKLEPGQGLVQNPEYNEGKPWFVAFRPLLHNPHGISSKDLESYSKFGSLVSELERELAELKQQKVNVYEIELELNLAKDKMKRGQFGMAETYLLSVKEALARKKGIA